MNNYVNTLKQINFLSKAIWFAKNNTTELVAFELFDRVLGQMDEHTILIYFNIDLSKAFDSLRHDHLLDKQSYSGITHPAKN